MNCKGRTKTTVISPRKTKVQRQYNVANAKSPLLQIPGFDPLRQVLLDYMHLLCNVIMKTLLKRWT